MAIVIVQKPDSVSMSGNMKILTVQTAESVVFTLAVGGETVLEETYYPGNGNLVEIDLREVVETYLSFTFPSDNVFMQPQLARQFTGNIGGTQFTFVAVRSAKARLNQSASAFLKGNWLTWQPQEKEVTYYSPEWLTYYAVEACSIKLKAYFEDGTSQTQTVVSMSAGACYTVNMQYAVVSGMFSGKRPTYYDVWTETSGGARLSYVQRYIAGVRRSEDESWYLFENSLGGLDSLRAYGALDDAPEYEHQIAQIEGVKIEYRVDTERRYTRNTGYLSPREAAWLQDMFGSLQKYAYTASGYYRIVFTDSDGSRSSQDIPSSYTFTYQFAEDSALLDLERRDDLPSDLQLTAPDGELFYLPPRLAEFPALSLAPDVLLPAQEPHTERFGTVTCGGIIDTILNELINDLKGLDMNPIQGGGGGLDVYIIKTNDLTVPTDDNVFSALRTLDEIERSKIEMSEMFLRKDIDDTAHGNITFDQSISSTVYLEGFDGKGWKIENTGLAELDGARIRSDVFLGGKVGSPSFASGFTGWGWEIDTPTASGTVDNWTVRKSMKVYELVYSQIYGLSGSVMITDFNKIKTVEPLGTNRYHCVIDDMDGEMFMNLRNGDIVRVQKRDGWNIRYYYGEIENVSADTFDIKIIDGQDTPQEGDVCFRMGSKTDVNRQGLVYLTSSDDYSAYIDILDGIDGPSFEGKTKVRLGNLRGLTVNGQPLDMHGIYINGGIFQHSSYYLDNGNTIEQQFTIIDGKFQSVIDEVRNDMAEESGNVLKNPTFSLNTNYWKSQSVVHFVDLDGKFLWLPSGFYVDKVSVADIYMDGTRNVLRILNASITQENAVMNIPNRDGSKAGSVNKSYSFAFYCRALRSSVLRVGFSGKNLYQEYNLEPSDKYEKIAFVADWDEKGDFVMSCTGEVLIYSVTLRNDALADAIIELETGIEQSAEQVKIWATKEIKDSEGRINQKYDSQLTVMADEISQRVTYSEYNSGLGTLEKELSSEILTQAGRITAVSREVDNINDTISEAGWITSSQGNQLYAKKQMENGATIISTINQTAESVSIDADKINLNGVVTANKNFQILSDGSMKAVNANLSGTITSTSGKIGGFTISSNSLYSERVTLSNDGVRMNYNGASVFINSVSPISGMTGAAIAINASSSAYAIAVKGGKIGSYRSGNSFIFAGQTVAIRVDNSDTWFNFVNGLFVGAKKVREINWNDYTNSVS